MKRLHTITELKFALNDGRKVVAVLGQHRNKITSSFVAEDAREADGKVRVSHHRELWIDFDSDFIEKWVTELPKELD